MMETIEVETLRTKWLAQQVPKAIFPSLDNRMT